MTTTVQRSGTLKTAWMFDNPHFLDDTATSTPMDEYHTKPLTRCALVTLTKSEENLVYYLKKTLPRPYTEPVIQYCLFSELSYFTTASDGSFSQAFPNKNCWFFSSVPWRTAHEYDPSQSLHTASTTSTGAAAGATSVPIADMSKMEAISGGGRQVADVWNGATYLGLFHYTAVSGSSGAGTVTVPASGYGSIGFVPTSLSGVGSTNPQTGAVWSLPTLASIPSGATVRSRIRTGNSSGNHTFLADPSSANFRAFCLASYQAYFNTTTTGTSPTNLWDGFQLDNLHGDASKCTSWTTGAVMPTPIGGTVWSRTSWDDAHVAFAAYIKTTIAPTTVKGIVWGNCWPQNYTNQTTHDANLATMLRYRNESLLDGFMVEDLACSYSTTIHSVAVMDRKFDLVDQTLTAGAGIMAVGQGLDVTQAWSNTARAKKALAFALLCWNETPDFMVRYTYSGGSNQVKSYFIWWPYNDYHLKLGYPKGPRVKTVAGSTATYTRLFDNGYVTYVTDGTTETAAITPTG